MAKPGVKDPFEWPAIILIVGALAGFFYVGNKTACVFPRVSACNHLPFPWFMLYLGMVVALCAGFMLYLLSPVGKRAKEKLGFMPSPKLWVIVSILAIALSVLGRFIQA